MSATLSAIQKAFGIKLCNEDGTYSKPSKTSKASAAKRTSAMIRIEKINRAKVMIREGRSVYDIRRSTCLSTDTIHKLSKQLHIELPKRYYRDSMPPAIFEKIGNMIKAGASWEVVSIATGETVQKIRLLSKEQGWPIASEPALNKPKSIR